MSDGIRDWSEQKATTSGSIWEVQHGGHDPDWPTAMEGFVETPHGIVVVYAGWRRTRGARGKVYEQGVVTSIVLGGRKYYGRMERPYSRRLGERGLTIEARKWAERVAREQTGRAV